MELNVASLAYTTCLVLTTINLEYGGVLSSTVFALADLHLGASGEIAHRLTFGEYLR